MDIPEEEDEVEEGAPAWMATFADMMSLLLTFFVLLLSFANMDVKEFRVALGSVREALGVQFEHPGDISGMTTSAVEMSKQESTDKVAFIETPFIKRVEEVVKSHGLEGEVELVGTPAGVIVRVRDRLVFADGMADVSDGAAGVMELVASVARLTDEGVVVEGHTDDIPIHTARYPSNWELSAARAAAAMRYLVDTGGIDNARVSIAGYGPTRPIASNETPEGRAKNRRVEFFFHRPPPVVAADAEGTGGQFADAGVRDPDASDAMPEPRGEAIEGAAKSGREASRRAGSGRVE